jgi:hypothetical protein
LRATASFEHHGFVCSICSSLSLRLGGLLLLRFSHPLRLVWVAAFLLEISNSLLHLLLSSLPQ